MPPKRSTTGRIVRMGKDSKVTPTPTRRFDCGGTAVMEVLLWCCTVPRRSRRSRRSWRCRGHPTADWPNCGATAEVLNMVKVSAVPPRRSAVLPVFRGATGINYGTTAEPQRPWRCNCGLCRTSTAVAPRLRSAGGTRLLAERRNEYRQPL